MSAQATMNSMADEVDAARDMAAAGRHRRVTGYLVAGVLLCLAGYGVLKLRDPNTLPIRHVRVKGEFQHLSTAVLEERAGQVVRGGFFNVNVETIQKVLLQEPWIREVSVQRVWPDRITVSIREQTAIARWNDVALLNDEGRVFAPDRSTFPAGIPVFRGPQDSYPQILEFYRDLRASLPAGLRIAEVTLSDRRAWQVGFIDGPHVYLGRTNIAGRKKRFVEYVPGRLGRLFDSIRSIDMRYTNGFAVRWEPDSKPDL